jgi:hypothetical protein
MTFEEFQTAVYKSLVRDHEIESHDAKVCVEDIYVHYIRSSWNLSGGNETKAYRETVIIPYTARMIVRRLNEAANIVSRIGAERRRLGR